MGIFRDPVVAAAWTSYGVVWLALAIVPTDRGDWLLENLLVFAAWGGLVALHRRHPLSRGSSWAVAAFLLLHALGANSTYSQSPIGAWAMGLFGLERNPYDRAVHFAFGLLLAVPLRQLAEEALALRRSLAVAFSVMAVLASGAVYEMIEWWAAHVVSPELGIAFVGAQGDVWDAQKDTSAALVGAILALGGEWLAKGWRRRPLRILG